MLNVKIRRTNKKGISPIVATVLLIGFVVAIIILVFLWGKNYIEELAEKRGLLAEKQQECTKLQLDVLKACWKGDKAEVVIKNNANVPIHKFIFRVVGGGSGDAVEVTQKLGGLEAKSYDFSFPGDIQVSSVDIVPHLKVALGHYVPCSKQKVTVNLAGNC